MSADTKTPIVEAIRQLGLTDSVPPTPLTASQLTTLLSDRLASETLIDIEKCLAHDPESAPLLRDLRNPVDETEPLDLGEDEIEAQWQRLRSALPTEDPEPSRSRRTPRVSWGRQLALAATLMLVVGLGGWAQVLRQEIKELSGPRANIEVVSLVPENPVRSAPLGERRTWSGDRTLLIFNVSGRFPYEHFRLELFPPETLRPTSIEGLMRHPTSRNFTVELPTHLLRPGRSRFVLSGLAQGDGWKSIANYELRLESSTPSPPTR